MRSRLTAPIAVLSALLLVTLATLQVPVARAQQAADPPALACPDERELCVQAERSGGIDLKTGVARLEGNVRGLLRSRELAFRGGVLTAFRGGGQEWVRLVLEQDVHVSQTRQGVESDSDHGVLEREEVRLTGNVRIDQEQLHIEGQEALFRADLQRTVVDGRPDEPLRMVLRRALVRDEKAPPPAEPGDVTTTLRALKAVLEEAPKRITLTGNVHIEQSDQLLTMDGQRVTLYFTTETELESFRAEGDVVITQPERRVAADFAQSRNDLSTILLVGNAVVQQKGEFDLKSERMEVFVDDSKGTVQSRDRQQPITLSLDIAGKTRYGLTQQHMLTLSGQGLPAPTLDKLAPLIGRKFDSRTEFRDAVAQRLARPEASRYLETILAVAR